MALTNWTPEELEEFLSPGSTMTVTVLFDTLASDGRVSGLEVLFCADGDLVLAWPRRKGLPPPLGAGVLISLLRREGDCIRRYGFQTRVTDLLAPQHSQDPGDTALMVIAPRPEDVEPLDYRRRKRYKVAEAGVLGLHLDGCDSVEPIDVSDRGMRYTCNCADYFIERGLIMELKLTINDSAYHTAGEVVNVVDRGRPARGFGQVSHSYPGPARRLARRLQVHGAPEGAGGEALMSDQTNSEDYYWIIVDDPKNIKLDETFLGLSDDTGHTFIPVTKERDSAVRLMARMPPPVDAERGVEAIHREQLFTQARAEGFTVYLVNGDGAVQEKLI